jgi:hypothetical protein
MCHWPIGDPANGEFTFCGRLRSRGAYCDAHAAAAYRPAKAGITVTAHSIAATSHGRADAGVEAGGDLISALSP